MLWGLFCECILWIISIQASTIGSCYKIINFLCNSQNRHPIAHLWGWAMGCHLLVQTLIYVPLLPFLCFMPSFYIRPYYNKMWQYLRHVYIIRFDSILSIVITYSCPRSMLLVHTSSFEEMGALFFCMLAHPYFPGIPFGQIAFSSSIIWL